MAYVAPVSQLYIQSDCYKECQTITSVNLHGVSWQGNSMSNAFYNCQNLVSVDGINPNVAYMSDAFHHCVKLTTPPNLDYVPDKQYFDMSNTFRNCYSLQSTPRIPNGVTSLWYTFANCNSITHASNIPSTVSTMCDSFAGCTSLIDTPNMVSGTLTNLTSTFSSCNHLTLARKIPDSVNIMDHTFYSCSQLQNAPEFPSSLETLNATFYQCYSLVNIPTLPNSLKEMEYSFGVCNSLVNAPDIPNSVVNMVNTFFRCSALLKMPNIGSNVVNMSYAFYDCSALTTATNIPASVKNMTGTFKGCGFLGGNIYIYSKDIYSASECFNGTTLTKNIYVPFTYDNVTQNLYAWYNSMATGRDPVYIYTEEDGSHIAVGANAYYSNGVKYRNTVSWTNSTHLKVNGFYTYSRANTRDIINGSNTCTYESFRAAGYDEIGTKHGVCLKRLGDEVWRIDDTEYTATFDDMGSNHVANVAHLTKYIGTNVTVTVPKGLK